MPYELLPILLATLKTLLLPFSWTEYPLKGRNAKHIGAAGMALLWNTWPLQCALFCRPPDLSGSRHTSSLAPPPDFPNFKPGKNWLRREGWGNDKELHAKFVIYCWQRALQTTGAKPNLQKGSTVHHGTSGTWDTPCCLTHKLNIHCRLEVKGRQVSFPSQLCWSPNPTLCSG